MPAALPTWRATFGAFTLSPSQRLLERDGVPVRLGGRALDVLITLVQFAGRTVSKGELFERVWRDSVVDDGALRFHMVAVRKALGDGIDGQRFVVNTASKGYTFVADVERQELRGAAATAPRTRRTALPAIASTIIGREAGIAALVDRMLERRLVSVVGPGGIGKTTIAIAAAHAVTRRFDGDVHFIDLSFVADGRLVVATVASAVGLQNASADVPALAAHLARSNAILILDCCEHVIGAAAEIAQALVLGCPDVRVLATSREPLQAEGEFVCRLDPLSWPREDEGLTASSALIFPAVRLLVDRAAACRAGFVLSNDDAAYASQICRELEGVALAIELAAGRVEALGLKTIATHFDAAARLFWTGRRTANLRHRTLAATLDWSYALLSGVEQRALRRLSIFAGTFSLEAAVAICFHDVEPGVEFDVAAGLVAKSLLVVEAGGASLRYRLAETTRAYSLAKLGDADEANATMDRCADYFVAWILQRHADDLDDEALVAIAQELANLRATLDWLEREEGRHARAVRLAAGLCPALIPLSHVSECARRAHVALSVMPHDLRDSRFEVMLQAALGQSLMYTMGDRAGEAAIAFERGIEVAERLGNWRAVLYLLNGSVALQQRAGRYRDALATARRADALLDKLDDPAAHANVDSMLGFALHLVGDVLEAERRLERCFTAGAVAFSSTTSRLDFDFHVRALCGLARSLWIAGHHDRAIEMAEGAIDKAKASGHAAIHCVALIWAGGVHFWSRDLERMRTIVDNLESVAGRHALRPYLEASRVMRGGLAIAQGRPAEGVELIRVSLDALHECQYELLTAPALTTMARGLSAMSLHSAALKTCEETRRLIHAGGELLRLPELLVAHGDCLIAANQPEAAERSYFEALEFSRSHGMKSAELRAAICLARGWRAAGRLPDVRGLLQPLLAGASGIASRDVDLARALLE